MKNKRSFLGGLLAAVTLLAGCATTYTFDDLLIDAHDIAWLGTRAAVVEAPSSRDDLTRAAASLKVIEQSEAPTVAAISAALLEAGIKKIDSPRGQLYVMAGTIALNRFGRKWIAPDDYARARELARVLREGIEKGLAP